MARLACPGRFGVVLLSVLLWGLLGACGGGYGLTPVNNNNENGNVPQDCGNAQVDTGEECDGSDLGGFLCGDLGFSGGTLACTAACSFDTAGCVNVAECGDGVAEGTEECDGSDLAGDTCVSLGWTGGALACDGSCHFDTSLCEGTGPECGNGAVEYGESCDLTELDGETCVSQGFVGGTLACATDCSFDTGGCVDQVCGNGTAEGTEQCDQSDLGGATCVTQGFDSGALGCTTSCTFDTSACVNDTCGNGILDAGEDCEGSNLGGNDCTDVGFVGGTLACASNCAYNTSGCLSEICGNGTQEGTEQCDQGDLAGATCETQGFDAGTLACAAGCTFNTSGCVDYVCGNNTREGTEECDGGDLAGATCVSLGFDGGTLGCANGCTFDTSLCRTFVCGNGLLEGTEECDLGNFGGATCLNLGFTGGTLGCTNGCTIDTSGCTGPGCTANGGAIGCGDSMSEDTTGPPAVSRVTTWTGAGCLNWSLSGPEIVYSFNPGGQEEVVGVELTNLTADFDLMVMEAGLGGCNPGLACLDTSGAGSTTDESISFHALANTTYYIVVDGYNGASGTYDISFTCVQPTRMVYEWFPLNTTDHWDLTGSTITFNPASANPNGYTYAVNTLIAGFPSPRGTGTGMAQVPFTQPDDSRQISFGPGNTFNFFGAPYTSMWVNTHGNITFGQGDTEPNEDGALFAGGPPRIAGEWDRMNPVSTDPGAGRVWVEFFPGRVAVTWDAVFDGFAGEGVHSLQIEIFWNGQIRVTNLANGGLDGLCGITEGGGGSVAEVNFIP